MAPEKQESQTLFRMTAVVFLAAGAALVGLSALLDRARMPVPSTVCLHLGVVTVAVVLLDLIWRFCGGRPADHAVESLALQIGRLAHSIDVLETSQAVGLEAVYSRLGSFGKQDDWVHLVDKATAQVDLMGRTLFGWTRAVEVPDRIINRVVNHGVNFRILLMSPRNECLDNLTEERMNLGPMLRDKLSVSIDFFIGIRQRLPENLRAKLEIRCFGQTPLYCGLVRIDDRFYVTQYLHNASSDNSPFYCVHGMDKDWPKTLEREFAELWDAAQSACETGPLVATSVPT